MFSRFMKDRSGGVAVFFGIAVVPMLVFVGGAVDYARLASAQSHMQQGIDAAALEAGRRTIARIDPTTTQRDARSKGVYDANVSNFTDLTTTNFTITDSGTLLTVNASGTVRLAFGGIIGISTVTIGAKAQVPVTVPSLEVALVLDNTGSMAQNGKMTNLKTAAKNFLTTISTAQQSGAIDTAKIALVPFTTQVKLATSNKNANWLRFTPVNLLEPMLAINQGQWQGCVSDRDLPNDASLTAPSAGVSATLFPGANCQFSSVSTVVPLSTDFNSMRTAIDNMTANGNTNTTIGLAWGMNVLTNGMPLGDNAAPFGTQRLTKAMIFLTDGTNTQNRFSSSQSAIDARMTQLCNAAHGTTVVIYTVRVLDGNATLLQNCASTSDDYASITDASQLDALFQKIAGQLTKLRLSS